MSTVAVTGASGFVGSHVVPALLRAGHRVVAITHDDAGGERIVARLEPAARESVGVRRARVTGSDAVASLQAAFGGVDAVVHLVAIPRDRNGGRDLEQVNAGGTRAVIHAMYGAGVHRLVHVGALGVADDPRLHYARSKALGEQAVRESALDWTILKPSLLWGPRDGFFNIVAGLVRMSPGVVPVPGNGKSRFQPLWIDDLARCIVLALEGPGTVGQVYELGGPRIWTYREITAEVLRGMGRRRLVVPMPLPIIRLVAGLAEALHVPFPVATDQLRQLALDNVGPIDGVQQGFGFAPRDMGGNLGYLRHPVRAQEDAA